MSHRIFLTHYFETSKWHQGISEIAVEGARNHGLLNVGIQDFFETRHCLPQSLLEQENCKISQLNRRTNRDPKQRTKSMLYAKSLWQ